MTGTTKFFNQAKGYGFITPDDKSADIFVHVTALKKAGIEALREGERVRFTIEPSLKGARAINIARI